jgi:hypothetical protein
MVPAHNNQQQEKKDNCFDLRREEESKTTRQQGNDWICEGRKKWQVNMECGPSTQQPTTRKERQQF